MHQDPIAHYFHESRSCVGEQQGAGDISYGGGGRSSCDIMS